MPPSRRHEDEIATSRDPTWSPPEAFDEYELIRPLGSGRSGLVYLAHDTLLDRQVAIKFIPSVDDDALGRFLIEARAAARLQHPNVIALYRVGQLEGRPYLVSEFLAGTSLDRLARPVEPDLAARIAIDLTRGLAAAHRRGVLHRDIKPGNAILAESGEAKLLDFGLAKLRSGDAHGPPASRPTTDVEGPRRLSPEDEEALGAMTHGQLFGTPYFMPPEAWRGEELDERSDIFSLGILLYELVAGVGPFRDLPLASLPAAVTGTDARPIAEVVPEIPPELGGVIDRALRRDPAERFRTADEMLAQLELSRARRRPPAVSGNPYRGLRPFEPEHRAFFFGRDRPLRRALERLRTEPMLVVTGDSGVGKSSFCAAALIPAVTDGALGDGRDRSLARMVPGRAPIAALAQALSPLVGITDSELRRAISSSPETVGRLVGRELAARSRGALLYVDQLEELVTLAPHDEAEVVAEALGSLAAGLPAVKVVATARADFLSRLESLLGLRERVSRSLFLLAPLSTDEIREAIVGPAAVVGTRFESDELVDSLVESTAEGATPLLQFALAELWDRREVDDEVIREADLVALGGVEGALARHADALLSVLTLPEREAARAVLLRLVTVESTRTRRLDRELLALSPHAGAALESLVRGRLLVASETPDGTSYEIAHEALVSGWATLAAWLADEAETRALIDRVEIAASEWRHHQRSSELLWNSRQLAETRTIPGTALTPREREFLAASVRAARRRRWLRVGGGLLLIAAIAAVWLGGRMEAERERYATIEAAYQRADRAMTAARSVARELDQTRRAAFATFDSGNTEAGEERWVRVLDLRERLRELYQSAAEPLEQALLLDSSRLESRRRYAELLFDRAVLADRTRERDARDELIRRLRLYDEGGELGARWKAPARLRITSVPAGAEVTIRRIREREDQLVAAEPRNLGTTPLEGVEIQPGSVMLELEIADRPLVQVPVMARRGEALDLEIPILSADQIPEGFVWIPPGRALYGSDDVESVRAFFGAEPEHHITTGGYFIAVHETTYRDWILYLESTGKREHRIIGSADSGSGFIRLRQRPDGVWEIQLKPSTILMKAADGESIEYAGRKTGTAQPWLDLPISGVSYEEAQTYAAWLDWSERVPGARLCTEREWERAARGADGRNYPHGDLLAPDDANIDTTYGKRTENFGPDAVGTHPSSRSPFGVDDLAGNVWEWTTGPRGVPVARGGGFFFDATSARSVNRQVTDKVYKDVAVGLRICAGAPK